MKPWYKSNTFWFGLIVALIPTVEYLAGSEVTSQHPWLLAPIGAVIIILRAATTKRLGP